MSPERWRTIGELFDIAVNVPASEREEWLRSACDGDDDLRTEVANLLAHDAKSEHDAFLSKPEKADEYLELTPDWPTYNGRTLTDRIRDRDRDSSADQDASAGFLPKAAIGTLGDDWWADETRAIVATPPRDDGNLWPYFWNVPHPSAISSWASKRFDRHAFLGRHRPTRRVDVLPFQPHPALSLPAPIPGAHHGDVPRKLSRVLSGPSFDRFFARTGPRGPSR